MRLLFIFLFIFSFITESYSQQNLDSRVESLFKEGNFSEIIELKDSIASLSVSDQTIYRLAIAFYDSEQYKEALIYFNKVIERDSAALGSYFYASRSLGFLGKIDESLKIIDAGIRHHSEYSNYYCQKAELLGFLKKDEEAKLMFLKAIELDDKNINAYYSFGRYYNKTGKIEDALIILKQGIEKCNKEEFLYSQMMDYYGGVLQDNQQFAKSNDVFLELRKNSPNNPYVTASIIQNYFGLSLYDFAKPYQDELYKLYKDKKLPKDMKDEYCFERFKWDEGTCEAYEKFENPPNDGSVIRFHKQTYYFYGSNGKLKFSIQTELFSTFNDSKDLLYVLGWAEHTDELYNHATYSTINFKSPVDYKKLKDGVLKVLNKQVEPVTQSSSKRNK